MNEGELELIIDADPIFSEPREVILLKPCKALHIEFTPDIIKSIFDAFDRPKAIIDPEKKIQIGQIVMISLKPDSVLLGRCLFTKEAAAEVDLGSRISVEILERGIGNPWKILGASIVASGVPMAWDESPAPTEQSAV
jgi:hypothetical protein